MSHIIRIPSLVLILPKKKQKRGKFRLKLNEMMNISMNEQEKRKRETEKVLNIAEKGRNGTRVEEKKDIIGGKKKKEKSEVYAECVVRREHTPHTTHHPPYTIHHAQADEPIRRNKKMITDFWVTSEFPLPMH